MIIASAKSSQIELPPAGTFLARCFSLLDIGTHESEFQGRKKRARKIRLGFEIPDEKRSDGLPFTISKEFANSLHGKANLRKSLEAWRGRPFTAEELDRFDLSALLGAPALINITHADRKDGSGQYATIVSIARPMKGQTCPPPINPPLEFSIDQGRNHVFETLPDWLKEKITKCAEWALPLPGCGDEPAPDSSAAGAGDEDNLF